MSGQRILGKMVYQIIACWILLLTLYLIHEVGHLVLYNLLSNSNTGRIVLDGTRLVMYNPIELHPIADRVVRWGGLLATYPSIVLVNKKTPLLGLAALVWIIYGAYEALVLGVIIPY